MRLNGTAEDEQQLNRVRDWIKSYHLDNVDVADALSAFSDMSLALIEEIMDKLVNEGVLLKVGNKSFNITRASNLEYEFDAVKDENDGYVAPGKKSFARKW
ncbi:DNA-binding HORMA family protein [Artemisia annua]|uniref:DNA-binding HORMA family protein n=1 Tax=Artemisia annua TaxID=35608 RepID=A0A2U1N633_ARTAN|nr:DNA-binding HORMA family protein [Artemisia annua]